MSSLLHARAEHLSKTNAKTSPKDYEAGYLKHFEDTKVLILPIEKLLTEWRKNGRANTREADILRNALKEYYGIV